MCRLKKSLCVVCVCCHSITVKNDSTGKRPTTCLPLDGRTVTRLFVITARRGERPQKETNVKYSLALSLSLQMISVAVKLLCQFLAPSFYCSIPRIGPCLPQYRLSLNTKAFLCGHKITSVYAPQ